MKINYERRNKEWLYKNIKAELKDEIQNMKEEMLTNILKVNVSIKAGIENNI